MIVGTFILTLGFSMMNALGLNSQFDLFTDQSRYNANFGFINPILAGSVSGLVNYGLKKRILRTHVANHLYDIKALCNGFLAGVAGVSVGSGGMQPILAIISGLVSSLLYLGGCFLFRQFQIDDPLENCQIYLLPIVWSSFNSVMFMDSKHMMVIPNVSVDGGSMDLLGTQLLGMCLVAIYSMVMSWGYFFPLKRMNGLRISKAIEVIGHDTIINAKSKGLDLDQLIEKI